MVIVLLTEERPEPEMATRLALLVLDLPLWNSESSSRKWVDENYDPQFGRPLQYSGRYFFQPFFLFCFQIARIVLIRIPKTTRSGLKNENQ